MKKKISLVIPCFNEEANIRLFYGEAQKAFCESGYELEYVFVNDGSRDGTSAELKKLCESEDNNFRIVSFSRNFGKDAAIYAGLRNATGDYTCIIDADLQQRPEVVLSMAQILDSEPDTDCVAAVQNKRKESKLLVWFKNRFYNFINYASSVRFIKGASDFRIFRTNVRDALLQMAENNRFSKGLFAYVGFETKVIGYEVMKREQGESKYSFRKLIRYAVDGILAFSSKPLKLASYLGIFSLIVSIAGFVAALIYGLADNSWNPYALVIASVFFVGGMILLCMGIMGSYLAKAYQEVKKRPVYITKDIIIKDKKGEK